MTSTISYNISLSPIGHLLVAQNEFGLCSVLLGDTQDATFIELQNRFTGNTLVRNEDKLKLSSRYLLSWLNALSKHEKPIPKDIKLDLNGSPFQQRVWHALRKLPCGTTISYSELAKSIHQPNAVRAVASACAANPIALLVPCHRVIKSDGSLAGYRWGIERKKTLLDWEYASN